MTDPTKAENRIILGDRVPWFSAPLVTGGTFDLHVSAGRWVVLSFLGSPADPRAQAELAGLVSQADVFKEDHLVMGCVFTGPPDDVAKSAAISRNALFFLADEDGAISRTFGAAEMPRTIVLDPMLRAVADRMGFPARPCRHRARHSAKFAGGRGFRWRCSDVGAGADRAARVRFRTV